MTMLILLVLASILILGFVSLYWLDVIVKDKVSIVQSIVTIIAIVIGGVIAGVKLEAFRDFEPHLTVTHDISHRVISPSYVHIDVTATLHNSSRVKIELYESDVRLHQIAPLSDLDVDRLFTDAFVIEVEEVEDKEQYIQWDTLYNISQTWDKGDSIIEPGESHQESYDFIVVTDVESVAVYTYFYNPRFSAGAQVAEGWRTITVYDILESDHRFMSL